MMTLGDISDSPSAPKEMIWPETIAAPPRFSISIPEVSYPLRNSLARLVNFSAKPLYFVFPECFGTNTFF
jgi:hypothetical protein